LKDLSVILCTYNRASILAGALSALAAQQVVSTTSWELVVVDNNSNDGTADVVKEFKAQAPMPVTYVFEGRQGKTFALNTGASLASGRVLALTDDDCRPTCTWVQDVIDAMARHDAQGLGGRVLPAWAGPPPCWLKEERHFLDTLALLTDTDVRHVTLDGAWEQEHGIRVWGANMSFTRDAFERVGGFDVAMGPRGEKKYSHEDIDFVRRVLGAGFRVFYDPAPTVYHWIGPDRMRRAFFREHSFYYGEGAALKSGPPNSRHVIGVSPHMLGALVRDALAWLDCVAKRDAGAFERERLIFQDIGSISGYVKACVRTRTWAKLAKDPISQVGER
jgi:glycosyltransferase involved in cell wall biosynthesis